MPAVIASNSCSCVAILYRTKFLSKYVSQNDEAKAYIEVRKDILDVNKELRQESLQKRAEIR